MGVSSSCCDDRFVLSSRQAERAFLKWCRNQKNVSESPRPWVRAAFSAEFEVSLWELPCRNEVSKCSPETSGLARNLGG